MLVRNEFGRKAGALYRRIFLLRLASKPLSDRRIIKAAIGTNRPPSILQGSIPHYTNHT
jgi:hypothetical protein